jgi:hypothetical protein
MGVFNMIHSFLNPQEGYQRAQRESQAGWNEAKGYQMPFLQHGEEQYAPLNEARGALMNPAELENQWASGYETSPYAKQLLAQNQASGLDAASSMGLLGSSAALGNIQQGAGNIVQQDRQQYLNDLMQKYMQAIGLGENLYGTGAAAGANLGRQAQEQGTTMANLGFGEKNSPGNLLENLIKTGVLGAATYYGGAKFNKPVQ